ncbi:MAG: hypothetical protein Q8P41_02630 [Pseudomonadota bacterium]|nr:hypothetical protein [Pseudomonadota bacterium]
MADAEPRQLPGCGLAAFAMLLVALFTLGFSGVLFSTYSILQSGNELTPRRLSYGGVVDPSMLRPLQDAGLIGPDEVPDAYHAENIDGTAACAISGGEVVRLSPEGAQSMPVASITAVTGSDTEVVIQGDTSIVCPFGADEGGERFRRMLENR